MTAQKHSNCRDQNGVNLRSATYTANGLNQYSSRSNPASVDIIGLAEAGSSVTVNGSGSAYRHGEYFQKDLDVTNNTFAAITVAAGTNSLSGNLYIPPASESYSYDADGNLIADGRWSYLWDAENRLIEMRPQTNAPSAAKMWLKFEYDYLGRRIQKTAAQWTNSAWSLVLSNRFLYDDWNAIAELNATNNTLIRGYLWGVDLSGSLQGAGGVGGLIAVKEGTGDAHFAAYDGNGNVIALVNATTGTYSAQYEYDPFGQTIRATGTMAESNPYRFSTKYQDQESGFYYYGYRYYNPSTGRWLSRDPIGEISFFSSYTVNKVKSEKTRLKAQSLMPVYVAARNSLMEKYDVLGLDFGGPYTFGSGVFLCSAPGIGGHQWIEFPSGGIGQPGSIGFYPGNDGIWPGGPGTIQSPDPHQDDQDKTCVAFPMFPGLDLDCFYKCIRAQQNSTPPWYSVCGTDNCRSWSVALLINCKNKCMSCKK